jgi:dihydroneopterin aldolase
MGRDAIRVRGLRVECIIGIREAERSAVQPLDVDLDLFLDTSQAAFSGRIAATCDYDTVSEEVRLLLQFRRYQLLEMAAEEIAAMLLGVHGILDAVRVRLHKPQALVGRAREASVEVERTPADYPRQREKNEFGEVEILYESQQAGLYLLHVDEGRSIPPHYHRTMKELEWRVAGTIERDGRRLEGLDPMQWEHGQVHTYVNAGRGRATLFCCDHPPFSPKDEIVVDGPADGAPT